MGRKGLDDWARDNAGYVCLMPLGKWAAGVTDHGDIALSLRGHHASGSGDEEHYGQYLFSTSEAMNIARILVRVVALADAQSSTLKVTREPE
jgi:hypothetical protein